MTRIVRLALSHARRRKILTLGAIAVPLIMGGAVVTLTGDAARRSEVLLRALRDEKARSVTVRATAEGSSIPAGVAASVASLPGVERAVAAPSSRSVTAGALHDPDASIGYLRMTVLRGPSPIRLTAGRLPGPNEAIVSANGASVLRMLRPLTAAVTVDTNVLPVVGTFELERLGGITDTLATVALGPPQEVDGFAIVVLLAREPADVATIVHAVNTLIINRNGMTVDYEERAAEVQQTVAAAGNRTRGALAGAIVLAGAAVQLASALLNALLQRRENARRRALGFTRSEITLLVTTEATILSATGAALGAGLAVARLSTFPDALLSAPQVFATIALLVVVAIVASIPGAAVAAWQDPARILRVP